MRGWKRWAVVTVLISSLLAVLLAEVVLQIRLVYRSSLLKEEGALLRRSPDLGWELLPGAVQRQRNVGYDFVTYRTDERGFRRSAQPGNPADMAIFLGDSFVFGVGVEDDHTLPSLLNQLVPSVRFLNAGVCGYTEDQELLQYLRLREIVPHKILLLNVFLGNDIGDLTPVTRMCKPYFRWDDAHRNLVLVRDYISEEKTPAFPDPPIAPPWYWRLLSRSALAKIVYQAGLSYLPGTFTSVKNPRTYDEELDIFYGIMASFVAQTSAAGVKFRVIVSPSMEQILYRTPYLEELERRVARILDDLGIEHLLLSPAMRRRADGGASLYRRNEGHWNEAGNDFAAAAIAEAFFRKLSPPSP